MLVHGVITIRFYEELKHQPNHYVGINFHPNMTDPEYDCGLINVFNNVDSKK